MSGTRLLVALLAASGFSGAVAADGAGSLSPLPAPTGPYAVGRTSFDWTDVSRPDGGNGNGRAANGHREIVVWVWYPAAPKSTADRASWMPGKWAELFWSEFVARYPDAANQGKEYRIDTLRTHSYTNAPVASALPKFPVLLFAPGKGDIPLKYSSLIEDVVSHGYLVAGIVPTHDSGFSVFSDGRVVQDRAAALIRPEPGMDPQQFQAKIAKDMEEGIRLCAGDLIFTLNQLEKLNVDAQSPLKGRLDLKQVGALGHSQGGASSLQVAKHDPRVRAVFDLDGMLSPELADAGSLPKPILVLNSDMIPRQMMAANKLQNYAPVLQSAKPGYHLRLTGSTHYFSADFGLLPFLPQSAKAGASASQRAGPLPPGNFVGMRPTMPLVGSIDPARALSITKAYVEAFFDQYLKGKKSTLLNGPSPDYPEISFEKIGT